MHDTAARQAMRNFPLDFEPIRASDETRVHVVIVGFGPMGKALALHAARIGHFANGTPARKTRITVVNANAKAAVVEFKNRYSKIDEFCELSGHDLDHSSSSFTTEFKGLLEPGGPDELQTVVFCGESAATVNNRDNLRFGLEFVSLTDPGRRQLLTYQSTRTGLAAQLPTDKSSRRLHPFGMVEDLQSWSVLLHESEDRIARAIHEKYVKHHGGDSWEALSEDFKESNRHAADHVPVKLRALGYHDAQLEPGAPRIEHFSDHEKLLMAKMEHERWCAERWLGGWKFGSETNKKLKISKDLVPWERLLPEEEQKDFEQIKALPEILRAIGRGIYR
ncbi:MAG: RyR domain-containing protein [Planctomycetota bacterium]